MLLVMIATSSTHSRHVELVSIFVWVVHLAQFISLLISSISVAYWVTASTPPCLIRLLIFARPMTWFCVLIIELYLYRPIDQLIELYGPDRHLGLDLYASAQLLFFFFLISGGPHPKVRRTAFGPQAAGWMPRAAL